MLIKKIQIKDGYRRFHNLTIDLGDDPKRIIALVGPNGCGKSSVLDAILFVKNSTFFPIGNLGKKDNTYHSQNQLISYHPSSILINFLDGDFNDVHHKKCQIAKQNTIFSFRSPYRYNSVLKVSESKAMDAIESNSYGATVTSDIDSKMEENYRRLYMKYSNYRDANDIKPSEAKNKIISDLNSSLTKCLDLKIVSIGEIESRKGTLYFVKDDQPSPFEFNSLSSGEKEVVDILLDLYLRQEEYNDTIFLIDEPELHINTSIQKMLMLEISRLIGESCQIWIVTHSVGFLRALKENFRDECQIIQFEKDRKWASEEITLKPIKKTASKWKEVFETALDDLSNLVAPNRIIYCEGLDMPGKGGSENGLDAKVYNNIFGEKYHDTLFISSGGGTELDQRSQIAITILTKVFSNLEILVLKDLDSASGKPMNQNDRIIFLSNNPSNYRMLKRWEIENYLFDKEVLKAYCEEMCTNFDETNYDKHVKNIYDDHVKDDIAKIKNFCGINSNVNNNTFKIKLSECIKEEMKVYKELESCIFNSNSK